jgi:hypothetical protein
MDQANTSTAIVKPMIVDPTVDHREHFTIDRKFHNRDQLKDWIGDIAKKLWFVAVMAKSDNGGNNRKPYIIMGCQRGGTHRAYVNKKRELTRTLKCQWPFKVRSYCLSSLQWSVSVIEGTHNHKMESRLEGHKVSERLLGDETILVHEMTKNHMKPRHILSTIRGKNLESSTTSKHIYNLWQRMRTKEQGGRTEIQQLFKCLSDGNYTYGHRLLSDGQTVSDIFFAHHESIKLFNLFLTVLLLDSTYKTNKYKLPLLEFVGTTSTEQTFSVGFALLSAEKESNFVWALQKCRELLKQREHPDVVVTGRDNALMNDVDNVFPRSVKLLCRYHISCNVRGNCKGKTGLDEESEEFITIMAAWENILDSVIRFRQLCIPFPTFLEYVESTILGPVKEKVVTAWTKRHMHLGNTTTNRCESTHARLKKYIQDSMGDFIKKLGRHRPNVGEHVHRDTQAV